MMLTVLLLDWTVFPLVWLGCRFSGFLWVVSADLLLDELVHWKSAFEQMFASHRQVEAEQTGRIPSSLDFPMHYQTSHHHPKQPSQQHARLSIPTDLG